MRWGCPDYSSFLEAGSRRSRYGDILPESVITRRKFLKLTLGAGLVASSGYILKEVLIPSPIGAGERLTLEAFLETLIPSDLTPGALELGVARKILARASADARYRRLVKRGCGWLDGMSKRRGQAGYASLNESQREEVAGGAAAAPAGSVPRIFFEVMRSDAFFHYYANPASWAGLGYKGPPQPDGYRDYTEPQAHV